MNPIVTSIIALVALVAVSSYALCSISKLPDEFEDPIKEVDDES